MSAVSCRKTKNVAAAITMIDIRILLAIRLAFRDRSSRSRHESSNNVDEKYLINCLLRLDCNDAYDVLPKVVSEQGQGNGTTVESPPLNMSTALFSIEVESHSSADIIIFASLADSQGLNGRRIGSSVSSSMNHISNLTATTSSEDYCAAWCRCQSAEAATSRTITDLSKWGWRQHREKETSHRQRHPRGVRESF